METKIEESGFLLVDKPVDWTSHDVVGYLRGVTKIRKIGHAGTLDPFATGLLIVAVSRAATKRIDEFVGMPKEYIATVQLGATSDTQDLTGTISPYTSKRTETVSEIELKETLASFVGAQHQIPPMYSAKKVKGKKLYELARAGEVIERAPVDIEIYEIELQDIILNDSDITSFTLRVRCSKGTYIRTLANDIGEKLGVGAYCSALRRTKIGEYSVEDAIGPKEFEKDTWVNSLFPA